MKLGLRSSRCLALVGLALALVCGLIGGLFARLLITSLFGGRDRFSAFRRKHPIRFAAACGLAVAVIGILTQASAVGGGHAHTRTLLAGDGSDVPLLWTLLKFVATWLSAWSGAPGGLFTPSLAIGASLGHDVALLLAPDHATMLIALGMAGFLAAMTQTPITAMIIVMEMVDGYAMLLGLMSCALLASLVSRMVSRPLYATIADQLVARLEPDAGVGLAHGEHLGLGREHVAKGVRRGVELGSLQRRRSGRARRFGRRGRRGRPRRGGPPPAAPAGPRRGSPPAGAAAPPMPGISPSRRGSRGAAAASRIRAARATSPGRWPPTPGCAASCCRRGNRRARARPARACTRRTS